MGIDILSRDDQNVRTSWVPRTILALISLVIVLFGVTTYLAAALERFRFWRIQSDHIRRGFSSRKAARRCRVLFRGEVKML